MTTHVCWRECDVAATKVDWRRFWVGDYIEVSAIGFLTVKFRSVRVDGLSDILCSMPKTDFKKHFREYKQNDKSLYTDPQ